MDLSLGDGRLASIQAPSGAVRFAYDEQGTPLAISLDGYTYVYRTDARGSVVELTDTATGAPAATYLYDAWGKIVDKVKSIFHLRKGIVSYWDADGSRTGTWNDAGDSRVPCGR